MVQCRADPRTCRPDGSDGPNWCRGTSGRHWPSCAEGPQGDIGPTGPTGATGPAGPGVAAGGGVGQILSKTGSADYVTGWIDAAAGGDGGITPEQTAAFVNVTGDTMTGNLTAPQVIASGTSPGLQARNAVNPSVYLANADGSTIFGALEANSSATLLSWPATGTQVTLYTDRVEMSKPVLLPGNPTLALHAAPRQYVDNATTLKADKTTAVTVTLPITGTSTLPGQSRSRSTTSPRLPWHRSRLGRGHHQLPARSTGRGLSRRSSAAGGHASFTFNSAITEPPTGNQLRINNASQTAATRMWVSQTATDGLDISIGLAKILAGHQIYMQDFDDASKWVKYTVTADGVDDGVYYDYAIAYHSGPANVPFQTVEFQPIAPGTVGVPPGGTTAQALTKTSGTDYAVGWSSVVANGGTCQRYEP